MVIKNYENVSDQDLVELAGYHAYINLHKSDRTLVNGTEYEVINENYENPTGLDALTVQNLDNKEITVVYVGTDKGQPEDILTDAQLLSDMAVPQVEDAKDYFEKMDKAYGVDNVTGNSLGGALANAVAVENQQVRSVTYNPALLPATADYDPNKDYDNITNYIGQYDVLNGTLNSLKLDERVPGNSYTVYNGMPGTETSYVDLITSNHTGYLRNKDKTQYYEIRPEGGPGSGKIYIEADEHIVLSPWTGQPIYQSGTEDIKINPNTLRDLAVGLDQAVFSRMERIDEYLNHAMEIIEDEAAKKQLRIQKLRDQFEEVVETTVNHPLIQDIIGPGFPLLRELDVMSYLQQFLEEKAQELNQIYYSAPFLIRQFFSPIINSISNLVANAGDKLTQIIEDVESLINGFGEIIINTIPTLFYSATNDWEDAVVEEFHAHFRIVLPNCIQMAEQLKTFQQQILDTAEAFQFTDEGLASAIQAKANYVQTILQSLPSESDLLKASSYLTTESNLKGIQSDVAFTLLKEAINKLVVPLIEALHILALAAEGILESFSATLKSGLNSFFYFTPPGWLISIFTDFETRAKDKLNDMLQPVDEFASRVEGVRDGLGKLRNNMSAILDMLRPYIENAIFDDKKYRDVYLYNNASLALTKEMGMVFRDINTHLAEEKAQTIRELLHHGGIASMNINRLEEQVDRATLVGKPE
ncbi:SA1320 family protein [Paraliobacillus ryukyuensis]|uniref:SA1320 family protein n=1 Tax=Paraliobacillus ryukyuensis TaxID=200904 RepID=UPI0009A7D4B5|nr:hypothetical protein [Paraliobacillus ryukyuensis]